LLWQLIKTESREDDNMNKIDTSIDGYKYIGINLSQEQLNDLLMINTMMKSDTGKDIPVHCVLLVLKCLGLLPPELVCEVSKDSTDANTNEALQRKFGKIICEKRQDYENKQYFIA